MILGVDEVGRGCLAGPVAAGAVVLDKKIRGLKDSKLLTRQQREKFDVRIRELALGYGVGWASVEEINQFGITEAVRRAMHRAVDEVLKNLSPNSSPDPKSPDSGQNPSWTRQRNYGYASSPRTNSDSNSGNFALGESWGIGSKTFTSIEQLIVDGNYNYFANHRLAAVSQAVVKADLTVPAVSAASIISKVARDLHMIGLAPQYPGFGFESHVGYATPAHRRALRQLGATDIHRCNFRQVKEFLTLS